jgi:hypothetical protein
MNNESVAGQSYAGQYCTILATFRNSFRLFSRIFCMSQDPKKRTDDMKKASEGNIEQPQPVNKQDPTQPVEMSGQQPSQGGKQAKAL